MYLALFSSDQCLLRLQDELARVLVTLFDSRHLLYQLLWNMFSKEVELADSMQTLFRGNSLASKIMTFCFKVSGTKKDFCHRKTLHHFVITLYFDGWRVRVRYDELIISDQDVIVTLL